MGKFKINSENPEKNLLVSPGNILQLWKTTIFSYGTLRTARFPLLSRAADPSKSHGRRSPDPSLAASSEAFIRFSTGFYWENHLVMEISYKWIYIGLDMHPT